MQKNKTNKYCEQHIFHNQITRQDHDVKADADVTFQELNTNLGNLKAPDIRIHACNECYHSRYQHFKCFNLEEILLI